MGAGERHESSGQGVAAARLAPDHQDGVVTGDGAEHVGQLRSTDDLRSLVTSVRERLGRDRAAVVALAADVAGKPSVIVATTEPARSAGAKAGALVRGAAAVLGGGGGGKDDIAQGGGQDPAKTGAALDAVLADIARATGGAAA